MLHNKDITAGINNAVSRFVDYNDAKFEERLLSTEINSAEARRLRGAWSMTPHCLDSVELANAMNKVGHEAVVLVNEKAFESEKLSLLDDIATFSNTKHHVLVRATLGEEQVYIDPYWQQFIVDMGLTIGEAAGNDNVTAMPAERVLYYKADQLDDLSEWYAIVVRGLQNKIKSGVLRSRSDAFTRNPSIFSLMMGSAESLPVRYFEISYLRDVATRIWDPANYREVGQIELDDWKEPPSN